MVKDKDKEVVEVMGTGLSRRSEQGFRYEQLYRGKGYRIVE